MLEALQLGMAVPSAVGLCCTVADRRRRSATDVVPALVMTLAMIDLTIGVIRGWSVIAPIGWTAILLLFSLVPALSIRLSRGRPTKVDIVMALARSVTLIVMGGLAAMMSGGVSAIRDDQHAAMASSTLTGLLAIGIVAVVGLSGWSVVLHARRPGRDPLAITDAVAMVVGVATMVLVHSL